MVAVLPLHTVVLERWISWKPFLLALIVLVIADAREGLLERRWPWHGPTSIGLAVFFVSVAVSYPGGETDARYLRLLLAIGVGGAVLLVTEKALRGPAMFDRTLRTVFWSGAAMGATAVFLSLVLVGAFGDTLLGKIEDIPLVFRVAKAGFLESGFVSLSNWHNDPGFAAHWMNLWVALAFVAALRGLGSRRAWVNAAVVGSLGFGSIMTFSRTGWLGLVVATGAALWVMGREQSSARPALQLLGRAGLAVLVFLSVSFVLDEQGVGGDLDEQFKFRFEQAFSLGTAAEDSVGFGEADFRSVYWPKYLDFFQEDPLLGEGLGAGVSQGLQDPHNLGLELLGETGLVGTAGFVGLLGVLVVWGAGPIGWLALAITYSAAVTQTILFEPAWWFAAALLLAGGKRRRSRVTSADDA